MPTPCMLGMLIQRYPGTNTLMEPVNLDASGPSWICPCKNKAVVIGWLYGSNICQSIIIERAKCGFVTQDET